MDVFYATSVEIYYGRETSKTYFSGSQFTFDTIETIKAVHVVVFEYFATDTLDLIELLYFPNIFPCFPVVTPLFPYI